MREWQFITLLLLALVCTGLTAADVSMVWVNQRLQTEVQARQLAINNGILGQQGQQISQNILRDMANVAGKDAGIRKILERHSFPVQVPAAAAGTNAVSTAAAPAAAGAETTAQAAGAPKTDDQGKE